MVHVKILVGGQVNDKSCPQHAGCPWCAGRAWSVREGNDEFAAHVVLQSIQGRGSVYHPLRDELPFRSPLDQAGAWLHCFGGS